MLKSRVLIGVVAFSVATFLECAGASGAENEPVADRPTVPIDRGERMDDPYLPPPPASPATRSARAVVERGPFVSIQVNVEADGTNVLGDAANEPSIAVDPDDSQKLAIGWRQFDTVNSNFRQAGIGYSLDGGQTWSAMDVLDPGEFRTDPVLDHDHNGNFYYNSLYGTALQDCDVFKSPDAGITWLAPVPAFGGDKNWMAVDHSNSIGQGNIYSIWREPFSCCGENIFTRSTDAGATFMAPVPIPGSPALGTISAGPDGELYIAGVLESNHGAFRVAKSTNARDPMVTPTFDFVAAVNMGGVLRFWSGGPNPTGLLGQVWVATDHSAGSTRGNVYLLCSVDPSGTDPLDLHFSRSTDGALTWSPWVRINDDPLSSAWQWFGTMSVAPNGRIDAVWNDTRNTGTVNLCELYYAYSTDAGDTWSANVPLSPVFDSFVGWPQQNKLGDYYHMVSHEAEASLAYAATFNGEQDIYFLRFGDCNGNGVHDGADIAGGTSHDVNGNDIPDECECLWDIDGNGVVNPVDSGIVMSYFGCPVGGGDPACDASDIDGNGTVNPIDSGLVMSNFGDCP